MTESGTISIVPFSSTNNSSNFQVIGQPPFRKGEEPYVQVRLASPGYFEAIGTALKRGRLLGPQDDAKAGRVILVNETFAKKYLRGRNPSANGCASAVRKERSRDRWCRS